MTQKHYICDSCNAVIPPDRVRVRCRVCSDYDSCADCHVIESVSGTHSVEHDHEVYMHDRLVSVKQKRVVNPQDPDANARSVSVSRELDPKEEEEVKTSEEPVLGNSSAPPNTNTSAVSTYLDAAASETYWGQLLTPAKTLSPIFSRLTKAIFNHFDTASAGALQPNEFCALISLSGFTPQDFPPLQIITPTTTDSESSSASTSAAPADLHSLDAWLAEWMRSFPLDHRTATRTFPPPPPIEPVNGRIRMRDQLLHALMYPDPPTVPNGQPLLTALGLEQWFTHLLLHDPGTLAVRLNCLLGALSSSASGSGSGSEKDGVGAALPLTDPATGRPFEARAIPRSCFPLIPDPETMERKWMVEQQRAEEEMRSRQLQLQAEHNANLLISQAMSNVSGGWRVDSNGNRYYQEGYIR